MPLSNWRLSEWLGICKKGIRHRRRPLSRRQPAACAEHLEGRALLDGNGIVSGLTYIDADNDGENDANELVVRGIVVTLSNAGNTFNESVTTNDGGEFKFFRVPAGTYTLTAQPGTQLSGSAVMVENIAVDGSSEVNENIAMKGLKAAILSLREFRNTTTLEDLPFATAGDGRTGNEIPTVVANATSDVTFTTSGPAQTVDLAGVFTDQNFENSEVQFQTSAGNINVELFDKDTPITVANFYEYVTSNRYDNTFFHRLDDDFVLQGGGFSFNDATNTFPEVETDPMIQNEFSATRSNLASTIAMAKQPGNANSATNQFFFNLGNNSSNLDNQNGGFTVFGRIVGSTQTPTSIVTDQVLLDLIGPGGQSNTTVSDRSSTNSAFDDLPLDDYAGSNFPTDATPDHFLRINDIVTIRRNEVLSYTLLSSGSPVAMLDTSLFTAEIVNHRLKITPKAGQSGQAEIVIRATDLAGESVTTTIRVHVVPAGNVAPTATVVLNPASPLVNSTLTATATVSDGDSDPVNLTYVWKRGTTVVKTTSSTSSLTDTLDLSTVSSEAAGDSITVEVTPNDGFRDGTKVTASRTLVASNSAPTATVALTPTNPLVNSVLTATATTADVNGQTVKLTYIWKVGTTEVKTTSDTSNLTDTLDLSTLSEDAVGQVVTVSVTPNDGTTNGTAVTATRTISTNSAPTATVTLSPTTPTTTSTLTATATTSDTNGQTVKLTYVWKVGTNTVKTTSNTSNLTDTLDLTDPTIVPPVMAGDLVTVEVTPNDGTINGTTVSVIRTIS